MTKEELRNHFEKISDIDCTNSQGEPDVEYVYWLEEEYLKKDTIIDLVLKGLKDIEKINSKDIDPFWIAKLIDKVEDMK